MKLHCKKTSAPRAFKRALFFMILLASAAFLLWGCATKEERAVKKVIRTELDSLKNPDSETVSAYLSHISIPESDIQTDADSVKPELQNIFLLYFRNFSYRIHSITAEESAAEAEITVRNIDTKSLAKDFTSAALAKRITNDANPVQVEFSLKDSFLLLEELLDNSEYPITENTFTIHLKKSGDDWKVQHTEELDNSLTGNFLTYMADSGLLSPEEVVKLHFDTIKSFDTEQLNIYLSLDSLLDTDDTYTSSIAHAMAAQISRFFDYKIVSSENDKRTAAVTVEITSCDFKSIVSSYQKKLEIWLQTSEAMAGGSSGRREKERELLLSCIEENEVSRTKEVNISLLNDGMSWKLQMSNDIAQAILGGVSSALADVSEDVE